MDSGEIIYHEKSVKWQTPQMARLSGISVIHQEPNLASNLTVAENVLMGGIDLSVGSTVALCGVCAVLFHNIMPDWLSLIAALVVGGVVGYVNGFLTAKTKLPAL
jgi:predicted ABC-type sugar transport system permease subunit